MSYVEMIRVASCIAPLRSLAIIKSPRYGVVNTGQVGLSFAVYIAEDVGAPQFLAGLKASQLISQYQVTDVSRLEGKPCWVRIVDGVCEYDGVCLI